VKLEKADKKIEEKGSMGILVGGFRVVKVLIGG